MEKRDIIEELLKHRYAHRGLHRKPEIPENSMEAFRRAIAAGYGIELDVHLTADRKLAVIHDSGLKRTCGVDLQIEDLSLEEAQQFFLEESREVIPDFEDVLQTVSGRVPLIIELKVEKGNQDNLCEKLMEVLDGYEGLYCVESFSPAAVKWLREHRPDIVRGQLSGAIRKDGFPITATEDFLLKNLWVNIWGRPDFVAYKFEDRAQPAFVRFKGAKFFWTIRSYEDLKMAEALGAAAIFEKFDPADYEQI